MKTINFLKLTILFSLFLSSFSGFAQYTLIPDSNFEQALIDLNIDSGTIDGQVLTSNISTITSLNIKAKGVGNLKGIEDFVSLKYLNCDSNNPLNIDISKNTALIELSLVNTGLSNLDVSKNIELVKLNCSMNRLVNLDVSKNILLTDLICEYNELNNLDISKNTSLKFLISSANKLTSLDISKNTALLELSLISNELSNLDVSKNINLLKLSCPINRLTTLDVSKNTSLEDLYISQNELTNLDISKNLLLSSLGCHNNKLTTLDLSKNSGLVYLDCNSNLLTNFNLKNGQNTKLQVLDLKLNLNLSCIQVDNSVYATSSWSSYKDASATFLENCSAIVSTTAPKLAAEGDQLYCPTTEINIVTKFSITHDVAETGTQAVYIQISSGYSNGFDQLVLSNPSLHPTISTTWDSNAGKLKLSSSTGTGDVSYSDLEAAIKDIVFSNSSTTASGTRTFSITVGQANYLPSTGHYYLYVPSVGITWSSARTAADASTYYGLKGYLATILSADEAKLIGEQASGTGWIGGSDQETEGVWKWVTGPETGTVMSYTFWNNGEPNQLGDEDYAHITQPGVGIRGSWNDLSNTGSLNPGDNYQPKGYVVEYGGYPGELPLEIAASTKITIPVAAALTPNPICDSGTFTINATATGGATISWYDQATGGTSLATGSSFTTPIISTTTTYYVDAGCESNRKSVVAVVNKTPNTPIVASSNFSRCGTGTVNIQATTDVGLINWYTTSTGGTSVFTGNNFTTPTISSNTTYYAEATNNGCLSTNRTPVNITIYTPPVVTDEEVPLCQNQKKKIDAGISGMTYLWSTGETTQTIDVTAGGTYTVDVTSPAPEGCTSRKTIKVDEHEIPQIDRIDVNGTKVVIYLKKEQDYFEYSVDGTNFQDSRVFFDVPGGLQTAYVREKNGCGGTVKNFIVLVFPAFFTPNNDTFNDVWEVTGMENYPEAEVTIFDRYGKLIAQLTASKMSWDGTFNKTLLPASDYWYALKINDNEPVMRGHFSLKR